MLRLILALAVLMLFAVQPSLAGSASLPVSIPFSYVKHELIVEVMIGGAGPFTFMLDSDTAPSAIDTGLAKRLKIPLRAVGGSANGIGNQRIEAFEATIPSVRLGTLAAGSVPALALDLSHVRDRLGRRLDGVLGTSFLRGRVVEIDYRCRKVTFLPDAILAPFTARFNVGEEDVAADQNVSNDVWVGGHRILATFDTGDSGQSFVTGKGIRDLHLEGAARAGQASSSAGFGGVATDTTGKLNDVRIGSIRVGTLRTKFIASADEPFDVNIGNQTLQQFIAVFDYQRGLLTLLPSRPCT